MERKNTRLQAQLTETQKETLRWLEAHPESAAKADEGFRAIREGRFTVIELRRTKD